MELRRLKTLLGLALAVGAALLAATPASARDTSFKVIRSFCTQDACTDGQNPSGTLLMDEAHNLYGTTEVGGAHNGGMVYELVNNSDTGKFSFRALYNFCNLVNCTDGSNPIRGKLTMDSAGQIYGTTQNGGVTGNGTIFVLVPNAARTHYTLKTIHNFCQDFSGCEDGAAPVGGLTFKGASTGTTYDGKASLYGTTILGGRKHLGVVYQLTPNADQTHWTHKVLYFFCKVSKNCTDGKTPNEGLYVDSHNNVFGTTVQGGHNGAGVIFRLVPTAQGHWAETVLHDFCDEENCADGKTPNGGVIADSAGNVYGTTATGGPVNEACADGCGLLFRITPGGNLTTTHAFCSLDNCADGTAPVGLTIDANNNIFGMTNGGGLNGRGTIYEQNDVFVTLYDIKCKQRQGCTNGVTATGGLVEHPDGRLFGVLIEGGRNASANAGVAFQFTPS